MSDTKKVVAAIFEKLEDHKYSDYPASESQEDAVMKTWVEAFERNHVRPSEAKRALDHWVDTNEKGFMPRPGSFIKFIKANRSVRSATIDDVVHLRPEKPGQVWRIGSLELVKEANPEAREGVDYFTQEQFNAIAAEETREQLALPENPRFGKFITEVADDIKALPQRVS